jgi:hypothetical protein
MIFSIEVYRPFSIWPTKSSLDPMRSRSSRNSGGGVTLKQKISRLFKISHACIYNFNITMKRVKLTLTINVPFFNMAWDVMIL